MLREMLSANLYLWMLIFARVGSAMMYLPGFNSTMVSARVRLFFALILSFLILPALSGRLPPAPGSIVGLVLLLAGEIAFGLFIGLVVQCMVSALDVAG